MIWSERFKLVNGRNNDNNNEELPKVTIEILPNQHFIQNCQFSQKKKKKKLRSQKSLLKVLISKFLGIFIYVSKYVLRNVFAYSYSFVGYTRS